MTWKEVVLRQPPRVRGNLHRSATSLTFSTDAVVMYENQRPNKSPTVATRHMGLTTPWVMYVDVSVWVRAMNVTQ